ncbi:MAG: DUF4054 domain-containing protein [Bacteroidales bacterium]|nr:DUF4054 domain-containing protein [Bacteroidales bacterium]
MEDLSYVGNSGYDEMFDVDVFCSWFPEFDNRSTYSAKFLTAAAKQARMWISREECAHLQGEERMYAYYLMIGHLIIMTKKEQNASDPSNMQPGMGMSSQSGAVGGSGLLQSASVGGVSVSLQVPQYFKGAWDWWLGQTPYGQKLLAFLESRVPVAIYGYGDDIRDCIRE